MLRRPTALLALVIGVLGLGLSLGAAHAHAASVLVTRQATGSAVPAGFLGISTEVQDLEAYTGTDPDAIDPAFLRLLGALSPGQRPVLRVGGDSTDWSWYPVPGQRRPPGVTYTITPRWLQVARATAAALDGRLILGVNLEADDVADAAGEARAMLHVIGRRDIEAMEIGNEPELYHHFAWYHTRSGARVFGRGPDWSPAVYRTEYAQFAAAMPAGLPLAGPVSGIGTWLQQLGTFLDVEHRVSLVTIHAYPLKHCTPSHVVTIPEVLADSASDGFVDQVTPFVRVAQAHHRPIRIDEVNAISCGGTAGVSDSFASALWMLNTLFGLAHTGVGGVNVHMVPGSINAILNPIGTGARRSITVQPEFYAMEMFAQAAPPGSRIVRLQTTLPPAVQAWATRDAAGTVRVLLINRGSASVSTALSVPGASGPAGVEPLRARGLAATQGVSLGGQSFGAATGSGELAGAASAGVLEPHDGRWTVALAPASAELITLHPSGAGLMLAALRGNGGLVHTLMGSW